jgi:hypothetical protein
MLKIDLHVHTCHSDSSGSVREILEVARRRGLDGIAIMDHDTTEAVCEALEERGKLIIIGGEEVKTKRGEILALGINETIQKELTITDTINRIHTQGGLAVIPHPSIPFFSKLREKDMRSLPIDGLEAFSAITPFSQHFLRRNLELAQRLGKPVTGGSDSHHPATVGDAYTIVYSETREPIDILQAIKLGQTEVGGNPSKLAFKLRMTGGLFTHIFRNSHN